MNVLRLTLTLQQYSANKQTHRQMSVKIVTYLVYVMLNRMKKDKKGIRQASSVWNAGTGA